MHYREPLKEALESKRPLTRSVLESRISEIQSRIDDAVARKDFTECAPLQAKLDSLMKKRKDLPTIDELKDAVKKAEKDVADAAARRDFKGAASYQVHLFGAVGWPAMHCLRHILTNSHFLTAGRSR